MIDAFLTRPGGQHGRRNLLQHGYTRVQRCPQQGLSRDKPCVLQTQNKLQQHLTVFSVEYGIGDAGQPALPNALPRVAQQHKPSGIRRSPRGLELQMFARPSQHLFQRFAFGLAHNIIRTARLPPCKSASVGFGRRHQ